MNIEIMQKGSLISLAMLAIGTGISLISQSKILEGVLLVVIGFCFVLWREYLKMHYQNTPRKKK